MINWARAYLRDMRTFNMPTVSLRANSSNLEDAMNAMSRSIAGLQRDMAFMERWKDDPQIEEIAREWVLKVDLTNYDGPDDEDIAFDDYLESLRTDEHET